MSIIFSKDHHFEESHLENPKFRNDPGNFHHCLKVEVLTSSSRNLASGMSTDFKCQILGLNVVVLTSSSRNLPSAMCTDIIVLDTGTQCFSTDL